MSLIKHSSWNIIGAVIPTLIAVPTLGIMARKMGVENFGLFTLLFALVGYASIFDVGISRAVTRMISIHKNDKKLSNNILSTSSWSIFIFSLIGMLLLFQLSPNITQWLNVSERLYDDTVYSIKIMSFSIPIFLLTQVWLGYLEGLELFAIINKQRIFTSSLMSILPLISLYIDDTLSSAIFGLLIARLITLITVYLITIRNSTFLFKNFDVNILKNLLTFGGWLTASNIISPIMVYFDRFILSNISGASVVAQYTAPSDLVGRLGVIPASIAKALFPKLTLNNDSYKQGVILLGISSIITIIPLFIFANELLTIWLGNQYTGLPATVLQILLVGFFFNAIAQAPFAAIQAKGAAKTTAYVHLLEVIPYLAILYVFINFWGVIGVALAWTLRVIVDSLILFFIFNIRYKLPIEEA